MLLFYIFQLYVEALEPNYNKISFTCPSGQLFYSGFSPINSLCYDRNGIIRKNRPHNGNNGYNSTPRGNTLWGHGAFPYDNGNNGMISNYVNGLFSNGGNGNLPFSDDGNGMLPNGGNGMLPNGGNGMLPNGGNGMLPNGGNGMLPNGGNGMLFSKGNGPFFNGGNNNFSFLNNGNGMLPNDRSNNRKNRSPRINQRFNRGGHSPYTPNRLIHFTPGRQNGYVNPANFTHRNVPKRYFQFILPHPIAPHTETKYQYLTITVQKILYEYIPYAYTKTIEKPGAVTQLPPKIMYVTETTKPETVTSPPVIYQLPPQTEIITKIPKAITIYRVIPPQTLIPPPKVVTNYITCREQALTITVTSTIIREGEKQIYYLKPKKIEIPKAVVYLDKKRKLNQKLVPVDGESVPSNVFAKNSADDDIENNFTPVLITGNNGGILSKHQSGNYLLNPSYDSEGRIIPGTGVVIPKTPYDNVVLPPGGRMNNDIITFESGLYNGNNKATNSGAASPPPPYGFNVGNLQIRCENINTNGSPNFIQPINCNINSRNAICQEQMLSGAYISGCNGKKAGANMGSCAELNNLCSSPNASQNTMLRTGEKIDIEEDREKGSKDDDKESSSSSSSSEESDDGHNTQKTEAN